MTSIAIIGAGLAGLTAANLLNPHAQVTVFEKSRGFGGRMATRYAKPYQFDHGAQFFKARSKAFQAFLAPMIDAGVIQPWHAKFAEIKDGKLTQTRQWGDDFPHYVGVPEMSSIGEYLKEGVDVCLKKQVSSINYLGNHWYLTDDQGQDLGRFDWLVLAIPAVQAAALLPSALAFSQQVKAIEMKSCLSLMLGFEQALALPFDAARVLDGDISWISVNNSKPGRHANFALQIHSTNDWAAANMDADRQAVLTHLLQQTSEVIGYTLDHADHQAVHRWRYANIDKQAGEPYLLDAQRQIAVCGDWLIQGRVESAYKSGHAAASDILQLLSQQPDVLSADAA